jgi:hypothetical protein
MLAIKVQITIRYTETVIIKQELTGMYAAVPRKSSPEFTLLLSSTPSLLKMCVKTKLLFDDPSVNPDIRKR